MRLNRLKSVNGSRVLQIFDIVVDSAVSTNRPIYCGGLANSDVKEAGSASILLDLGMLGQWWHRITLDLDGTVTIVETSDLLRDLSTG